MKKLLFLGWVLLLLPAAGVHAAEDRRSRSERALPGPQEDVRILCDRLLDNDDHGGQGDASTEIDRSGDDDLGPDDVYDGI